LVCAAETGFLSASDPDHVRAPDAAFVSRERLAEIGATAKFWPGPPDLAVEAVSPNDAFSDVEEKVIDWLEAGTRIVLLANPPKKTVTVYRWLNQACLLNENDAIDGDDVVPGFRLPVKDVFR